MKQLLIAVLLACCQAVSAQSIDQIIDSKIKASETRQKAYADSLYKVKGNDGGTQNPPNDLPACDRGPEPKSIFNVTTTTATVLWDGQNVFGWDYSIYKGNTRVAFGSVKPASNSEPITYAGLEPGEYTLSLQGNTCKSDVYSKTFTVPKPTGENGGNTGGNSDPPPVNDSGAKFEFILGTTGQGFQSDQKYGIDPKWIERIEAFHYSWGWGITGICVWVPWVEYEKTPGVYEEAAFKRIIAYCRERGLGLSVAFLGRRKMGDGFILESEIIKGSNGTPYKEGPPDIYASYGCDRVNANMTGAIKSIAKLLKTYEKSFYMAMAGGGAGELVNHTWSTNGIWETADFSEDNLNRFNEWAVRRGIAGPGPPPIIQGPGIDWPHPDFNQPRGVEFARFTTFNIYKYYKNFVDAVKSVGDIPCLYFYSVTSNRQFRAIANPNLNFIASPGDGMYGSDGDGPDQLYAKIKVNSVNLGTFPDRISAAEVDPDDFSPSRHINGRMPHECEGNLNYDAFLKVARDAYSRGLRVMHTAMSFCTNEIRAWEPVLKILNQEYIGKDYVRPSVNASNTVTVEVTEKYRSSQDLMEGIDPYSKYTRYTDNDFWGGVRPEVGSGGGTTTPPPANYQGITNLLDSRLGLYKGNIRLDIKRQSGTTYSYARGNIEADEQVDQKSTSKGVTAATIAAVISEGKISADTKVGDVLREWNKPDRRDITLKQILAHVSGIPDDMSKDGAETLEERVDDLANKPLIFPPGSRYEYSSVSYDVAARMIEVVTGQKFKDVFNSRIRDKCGMGRAEFNPRGHGPVYGHPDNPHAGYGLYASHNEMSNFAAMLRDNGMFNGQTVLTLSAMDLLRTQITPLSNWGFGFLLDRGNLYSESSMGISLYAKKSACSYLLTTQSNYNDTKGTNDELRLLVDSLF